MANEDFCALPHGAQDTGHSTSTAQHDDRSLPEPCSRELIDPRHQTQVDYAQALPDEGLKTRALHVADRPLGDAVIESRAEARTIGAAHETIGHPPSGRDGWTRRYTRNLAIADAFVGTLAVLLALPVLQFPFSGPKAVALLLGAACGWPLAVAICRGYERNSIGVGDDEMRSVMRAGVLALAVAAFPAAITNSLGVVATSVIAVPVATVSSLIVRFAARKNLHRQQRAGRNVRRVIVVGSAYAALDLTSVMARESQAGMQVVGVCVPRSDIDRARDSGLAVLGDLDQVPGMIGHHGADAVAVTGSDATRHNYLRELAWSLEGAGVELLVHPGLVEVAGPRMHIRPYVGLPLLYVEHPHFTGWRRFVKRATDLALTLVGGVLISPVLALIALAIKLEDGGPVIFKQSRVGLDGSTFTMYKFRSMHTDAESRLAQLRASNPAIGLMFKLQQDPRVTRVGRFLRTYSLDELPQLANVILGQMSLVGPRPPLQSEVDGYEHQARRRLLVTPGLTGLWQVNGRSLLSWEETVRLDLRYVENWTLTMDLLILWKTIFAVAARRGAY